VEEVRAEDAVGALIKTKHVAVVVDTSPPRVGSFAIDAAWPSRLIEWEAARWFVVCWDENGDALTLVGLHLRECQVNQEVVLVGVIGGVKTHPTARRRGLASEAIAIAVKFFAEQRANFGVLTCEPDFVAFYERLGWKLFPGAVFVTQRGERHRFTFDLTMILPIRGAAPETGVIDLLGPPW
jgi:GNAT superfamily N-acetyltransferase